MDIQLNINTRFSQRDADLAPLAGGGFVAVWEDSDLDPGDSGGFGVAARIYDAAGRPLGREFRVNADQRFDREDAQVVPLPDGGFAVAWESDGLDAQGHDSIYENIFVQRFAATGARIGRTLQVNPSRVGDARLQDLEATPDGGFRLVYAFSLFDTDWDIYVQRFDDRARELGGEVLINAEVATGFATAFGFNLPDYELTSLTGGDFIAAYWKQEQGPIGGRLYIQRYSADAAPIGPLRQISVVNGGDDNEAPRIAALAGGGYAVAWSNQDDADLSEVDVLLRTFDADGRALGPAVRVNTDLPEQQFLGDIVPLPDGGFLVTFVSFDRREGTVDLYGVLGRVYDAAGRPVTDAFDMSEFVYEDLEDLGTIRLADGTIVAAWSDGDTIAEDVYAAVFGNGTDAADAFTAILPGAYRGFDGDDLIFGSGGDDTLAGDDGTDGLGGNAGDDLIEGGAGEDALLGGTGRDTLVGGAGGDTFLFLNTNELVGRARDRIADFGRGDSVDLSFIDADPTRAGDQAFDFIGAAAFSGTPGDLRYSGGTLSGDLDGNGRADFVVTLDGAPALREADIVL